MVARDAAAICGPQLRDRFLRKSTAVKSWKAVGHLKEEKETVQKK